MSIIINNNWEKIFIKINNNNNKNNNCNGNNLNRFNHILFNLKYKNNILLNKFKIMIVNRFHKNKSNSWIYCDKNNYLINLIIQSFLQIRYFYFTIDSTHIFDFFYFS